MVTPEKPLRIAGVRKFRHGVSDREDQVGAVTGLAWTEVGGELLTIEAVTAAGKGQVRTTGKLGEVMTESVQAALSFVKARAPRLWHQAQPVRAQGHPHPPARRCGAQGRALGRRGHGHGDGVDADRHRGALGRCDDRRGYAAWPRAGDRGLKEKLLAALRGGITTVFIPEENEKDLVEIPANITRALKIIPVSHVDQVLAEALVSLSSRSNGTEADELAASAADFGGWRPRIGDSALTGPPTGLPQGPFHRKIGILAGFAPLFALTRRGETSLVARHGFRAMRIIQQPHTGVP